MPGNTKDPSNQKYLLNIVTTDTAKYKRLGVASLDYAFKAFSHLTDENRQQYLSNTNHEFFRVLVEGKENHLINKVLEGSNREDRQSMRAIINEVHQKKLQSALNRGDIEAIDYYLHAFHNQETGRQMTSVIRENDFACIDHAIQRGDRATLHYFLDHELTKDVTQDRLGLSVRSASKSEATGPIRKKPETNAKKSRMPSLNFKEAFNALLGRKSQVLPVDSSPQKVSKHTQTDDTDTDMNSSDTSSNSRGNSPTL